MINKKSKLKAVLEIARTRTLILDGGIGSCLRSKQVRHSEMLNFSHPEIVAELSRSYIKAGVDILTTNSFLANCISLDTRELPETIFDLNKKAVSIIQDVINQDASEKSILIAGSVSPIVGSSDKKKIRAAYQEQISALVLSGVDLVLLETFHRVEPLLVALEVTNEILEKENTNTAVWVSVVLDSEAKFVGDKTPIQSISGELQNSNLFAIGMNCCSPTVEIVRPMRVLEELAGPALLSFHPNAGLPNESRVYPITPEQFARRIWEVFEAVPLNIVGGCCGTTDQFISSVKRELQGLKQRQFES